ncbi:tetratricopeptide repeat protein [Roseovarius sp. SCSIO 43702]|uniref:tetratricopeptide repeat protein n=1 Tax=Roseovarius sp. SCSIO 43702 TaxID=2823043 RepID=UPI001C72A86B|nr:tetratricopeptide repeat protein [Roseovarius sp. SCSIO 43702]QYX57548.1 tetratricopeptide repeat protein [Roseovarius sp. SCSIO 43702]
MARAGILIAAGLALALAGCANDAALPENPYAPGLASKGEAVDGLTVGHRLMRAGEYELALEAFSRAALEEGGLTPEIMAGMGSANLGLRRLGQAETLLRDAIKAEETVPEAWNNLGVVLMEKGEVAEAAQMFRHAYALDNGQSDSIRDNLRLALAKMENSVYDPTEEEQDYKLVRRGSSDYLIRQIPI